VPPHTNFYVGVNDVRDGCGWLNAATIDLPLVHELIDVHFLRRHHLPADYFVFKLIVGRVV
jgi:hypothetical protein